MFWDSQKLHSNRMRRYKCLSLSLQAISEYKNIHICI